MATALKVHSSRLFTNLSKVSFQAVRGKVRDHKHKRRHEYDFIANKKMYPDDPVVRYGNMQYYPRDANYKDPPVTPSKLLMIQRVKPIKGTPHYDRKVLRNLGLDCQEKFITTHYVIHKNTEYICEELWKIKHLVKVMPITFPNGEPTEEDIDRTILTLNGEMIVSDTVKADPKRIEAQEKFQKDPLRLDGKTLRDDSRKKWINGWSL